MAASGPREKGLLSSGPTQPASPSPRVPMGDRMEHQVLSHAAPRSQCRSAWRCSFPPNLGLDEASFPFLNHQSYALYVKELKGNPHFFSCRPLQQILRASLAAQTIKRLSAKQETGDRLLGQEDPLEEEMAAHSSVLAWKIPWTEEPGGLQSMGSQRVRHD